MVSPFTKAPTVLTKTAGSKTSESLAGSFVGGTAVPHAKTDHSL